MRKPHIYIYLIATNQFRAKPNQISARWCFNAVFHWCKKY